MNGKHKIKKCQFLSNDMVDINFLIPEDAVFWSFSSAGIVRDNSWPVFFKTTPIVKKKNL